MRTLARLAAALVAVISLLGGGMLLLAEFGGEVVDLRTTDASGETFETRLWVVDDADSTWLWAAAPGRRWLERLRTHPEVQIVRAGEVARYRAVPVESEEARQRIGCLVVLRYGMAAHALALIHHVVLRHAQSEAVPIRLDPLEADRSTLRRRLSSSDAAVGRSEPPSIQSLKLPAAGFIRTDRFSPTRGVCADRHWAATRRG